MTSTLESDQKTAEPLVRLTKAGKHYGTIIARSDISLEVSAGEVTCVLGDNGAGRSTLIKIIAGLHQPSEGTLSHELEAAGGASAGVAAALSEEVGELGLAHDADGQQPTSSRTPNPLAGHLAGQLGVAERTYDGVGYTLNQENR